MFAGRDYICQMDEGVFHSVKTYPLVRSLDRGLRVLELFSEAHPEWTVAEIAQALDFPPGSAYRIVHTLELAGFVERSRANGPVRLGLRLIQLGWLVQRGLDIREIARPIMKRLALEDAGETALLMVPRENVAVCVEVAEGSYPIRPRSIMIGEQRPYHAGAVAMLLLAFLPDNHRERLLTKPLERVTPMTIIDPKRLRTRCAEIRRTGIAYSRDEVIMGTAAVAAPIFDGQGNAVASLGLTGIQERITGLDETIRGAARTVSGALGGQEFNQDHLAPSGHPD